MKKMMSASMALSVMEEPQVGPTVVMLILSGVVLGTALAGAVVVVVAWSTYPASPSWWWLPSWWWSWPWPWSSVVSLGACAAVTSSSAFCTFLLTASCWACGSLLMSDCTFSVCLLPVPRSSTVGSIRPVPFMASTAWVWVTPGAAMVHSVPPLNSMPRFSPPRRTIETMPSTMMAVEMQNQIRRLPTKSKRVSPR